MDSVKKRRQSTVPKKKNPQDVSDAPVNVDQETGENAPKESKDAKEGESEIKEKEAAQPSDSDTSFRDRKTPVRTVTFQVEKEESSQAEKKESSDTDSSEERKAAIR